MGNDSKPAWADLRLTDVLTPGLRVMLVGINPGVMSATSGHHFAGPTNRFWGLLYEAGIVPEPITHEDDVRLPDPETAGQGRGRARGGARGARY